MSLQDLFTSDDLVRYLRRNADSYAFKSDQWMFIHIPKTAGSSFREEIANVIQPERNVEVDYEAIDHTHWFKDFDAKLAHVIKELTEDSHFTRYRFLSGHIKYRDIARYTEFDNWRLISMLRDPLQRLLSDYHYQISLEHPLYDSVRKRYPTFEKFYADPVNCNVMYHYLCRSDADSFRQNLEFIQERYTFIGSQEMYDVSIRLLFALFGMRTKPHIRLRVNGDAKPEISDEEIKKIMELNSLDYALYEHFRQRLVQVGPKLYEVYDYGRIFRLMSDIEET